MQLTSTKPDIVLWLDDYRKPWQFGYLGAEWVKTAPEAIALLGTGVVRFASLDHDLLPEHYPWNCVSIDECDGTGFDVVQFLLMHPEFWPPDGVRVHSANPAGRARMEAAMERFHVGDGLFKWVDVNDTFVCR